MDFLNPLLLLGLGAAALPVIVHLMNRRRAIRRPFPALEFLVRSQQRKARSIKIRKWLLLALRIAALTLIPLAMARPFLMSDVSGAQADRLPAGVVFVVDDSGSMLWANGAVWEDAVEKVGERLDELRPWDKAAVVYASRQLQGTEEEGVTALTDDLSAISDALQSHRPTPRTTDLVAGLRTAAEILAEADLPQKRIILVTDRQKSGLDDTALPQGGFTVPIEVLDVRPEDAGENLAVVGASYTQRTGGRRPEFTVLAQIHNYGTQDAAGVQVALAIDGANVGTGLVDVPAGETVTKEFIHRFDAGKGTHHSTVSLAPGTDPLALDNTFHLPIHLQEKIKVLLVNGDPRSVPYQDELYYLERALNPSRTSKSSILTEQVGVQGLSATENLDEFDVVILANVERVAPSVTARLVQFAKAGGGVLLVPGNNVKPDTWNVAFAGLLPKPVRSIKQLARRDDPDAALRVVRFGTTDVNHPVFKVFDLPGGESIQRVPVFSYLLLEPTAPEASRIIASYSDGGPAIIERSIGEGRAALLTTTVDRDWTDFPIRVSFLVTMRRLVHYLGQRAAGGTRVSHHIGDRVEFADIDIGSRNRLEARDPRGERIILDADTPDPGAALGFAPGQVGIYEMFAVPQNGGEARALKPLTFAVNPSPEESDLREMKLEELSVLLTGHGPETSQGLAQRPSQRVGVWSTLLFLVTMVLLTETILGTRRSVLRRILRMLTGRSRQVPAA